jgi:hypothetical protein
MGISSGANIPLFRSPEEGLPSPHATVMQQIAMTRILSI